MLDFDLPSFEKKIEAPKIEIPQIEVPGMEAPQIEAPKQQSISEKFSAIFAKIFVALIKIFEKLKNLSE